MKPMLIFAALMMGVVNLMAQEPRVRTLETELPSVPPGVTPSTYPMPRTEWVVNVNNLIKTGRKAAPTTRLILDGDSITAGWRRFWKEHFPDIATFNFAIGGDRSQHLLWRISQGQLDGFKPDAVLLMIGTNNVGNGEGIEETVAGVKAVVETYRKHFPEAVIYVQGLLPRAGTAVWAEKIGKINAGIATLDDGKQVRYLDFSKAFLKEDGTLDKERMPDLLHPNEQGYAAWAEVLRPVIGAYAQEVTPAPAP